MSFSTTNMGLKKAAGGDNTPSYLETDLAGSLDTLDAHRHGGGASGQPVCVPITTQQRVAVTPVVDGANHATDLDVTTLTVPAGAHWVYVAMTANPSGIGGLVSASQQGLGTYVPYLQGVFIVANQQVYFTGWIPVNTANNKITYNYSFPNGQTVSGFLVYVMGYIY